MTFEVESYPDETFHGRVTQVRLQFDGKRLTPVAVKLGLSDDQWTELVGGAVRSGDAIVTQASVRRRRWQRP